MPTNSLLIRGFVKSGTSLQFHWALLDQLNRRICVMHQWTGKIYVFKDEVGGEYVSAANPLPLGIDPHKFRVFLVSGPFIPVGWPKPVAVPDAGVWIADLKKQGFKCEPCSMG